MLLNTHNKSFGHVSGLRPSTGRSFAVPLNLAAMHLEYCHV
jgi:hypothetical protein